MKLEREVLTMPEAFFDALKANGTTTEATYTSKGA